MSNQKQIIGNGPEVQTRSFGGGSPNPSESFFGGQYPGLSGNPYSDFAQGGGLPTPYEGGGLTGTTSSASSLLSGLNFNQIKGFVDRMGGVEGIIGAMAKVQKFVAGFQQFAPMLKVLFNSIGKGKTNETDSGKSPVRRRKRRKKSNSYNRKSYKSQKSRVSRK